MQPPTWAPSTYSKISSQISLQYFIRQKVIFRYMFRAMVLYIGAIDSVKVWQNIIVQYVSLNYVWLQGK